MNLSGLLTKLLVIQSTQVLNILNQNATFTGSKIIIKPHVNKSNSKPSFAMEVQFGCNGIEAMLIYVSAVAAFPSSWKKKLSGITAGVILIHIGNVLRIATLGFVGVYYRKFFEYFHVYILQGMMIAFALVIFIVYLHYDTSKTS